MAAQLYSHTSLAECLYDVLNEMVTEGLIQDDLAVNTLNQLESVREEEVEGKKKKEKKMRLRAALPPASLSLSRPLSKPTPSHAAPLSSLSSTLAPGHQHATL
jgi:hypothetical protein